MQRVNPHSATDTQGDGRADDNQPALRTQPASVVGKKERR